MKRASPVILAPALAALIVLSGCQGSPTEPDGAYVLDIRGVASPYATFSTDDGQAVIKELRLFLDGNEALTSPKTFPVPVASTSFGFLVFSARRGHHVLTIRLGSTSNSPTMCRTSEIGVTLRASDGFLSTKTVSSIVLPGKSALLSSGDALVFEFDV